MLTSKLVKRGENHYQYKGKAEFYLDNKLIKVDCLGAWCDKNGYDRGTVIAIARTTRDGFVLDSAQPGGKKRRLSCKGPLGIITKVRWLDD